MSTVLSRVEQLGRLGHEMHAGEHDDVRLDRHRLAGKRQAVADDVGDAVEDLRRLVIVRQDDGVSLPLEVKDGLDIVGEGRPFDGRNDAPHAVVEGGVRVEALIMPCPHYAPIEYN